MNIWGLTCFFNPCNSLNRLHNYSIFRSLFPFPLLTVEWSRQGQFELNHGSADLLIQLDDGDLMWQKERLIAIGEKYLPTNCDAFLIVDADIIFDLNFVEHLTHALKQYPIVYPYRTVRHLYPNLILEDAVFQRDSYFPRFLFERQSMADFALNGSRDLNNNVNPIIRMIEPTDCNTTQKTSPGHVVAFDREWYKDHSIYQHCIIGGGDYVYLSALLGCPEQCKKIPFGMNGFFDHYMQWVNALNFDSYTTILGCTSNMIGHLYHGRIETRQYLSRHLFLSTLGFNPRIHLIDQIDKPFSWNSNIPNNDLYLNLMNQYFSSRKEDLMV